MIVKSFRKDFNLQAFLLLVFVIILRLPGFINPPVMETSSLSPFGFTLLNPLMQSGVFGSLVSLICLILMGFIWSGAIGKSDFIQRNTLLPVFLLLLFYSHDIQIQGVHPVLIPALILLLVLLLMLEIYNKGEASLEVFIASMATSVCFLIYPPTIAFSLFIFLALLSNSIFLLRVWVIALIGLLIPILFVATGYFMVDASPDIWRSFIPEYRLNSLWRLRPSFTQWAAVLIISFFFIRGFWKVYMVRHEKVISYRKKTWVMIWFGLAGLLSLVWAGDAVYYHFSILTIPAVAFVAYYLLNVKKIIWVEGLMLFLIAMIIIQLYF